MFEFFDEDLTRTKELTRTISTLRRIRDSYSRTIQAWERFERQDTNIFGLIGLDALRPRWDGHLSKSRGNIAELRSLTVLIDQKLDLFKEMKDGVYLIFSRAVAP